MLARSLLMRGSQTSSDSAYVCSMFAWCSLSVRILSRRSGRPKVFRYVDGAWYFAADWAVASSTPTQSQVISSVVQVLWCTGVGYYIYIYIYIYIYKYIYIYVYVYIYICMCISIYICIHICIYIDIYDYAALLLSVLVCYAPRQMIN